MRHQGTVIWQYQQSRPVSMKRQCKLLLPPYLVRVDTCLQTHCQYQLPVHAAARAKQSRGSGANNLQTCALSRTQCHILQIVVMVNSSWYRYDINCPPCGNIPSIIFIINGARTIAVKQIVSLRVEKFIVSFKCDVAFLHNVLTHLKYDNRPECLNTS